MKLVNFRDFLGLVSCFPSKPSSGIGCFKSEEMTINSCLKQAFDGFQLLLLTKLQVLTEKSVQ